MVTKLRQLALLGWQGGDHEARRKIRFRHHLSLQCVRHHLQFVAWRSWLQAKRVLIGPAGPGDLGARLIVVLSCVRTR